MFYFLFRGNCKWRSLMFASAEENISQVLVGKGEKEDQRMLLWYEDDRKPWLEGGLSTGNKAPQPMWLCCTVQLLCCAACWTLRPGEHCLSPREILLSVCLLESELFCTWLIHFAGAGRSCAFFLDTIYLNSYGEKTVCVSSLPGLAAKHSTEPRQLWGVLAVQCSADMNAELWAWLFSPC